MSRGRPQAIRHDRWRLAWSTVAIALRSLLRQPRRFGLALAAVTFGIVALLLAGGFIEWIFHDLRESTIRSQLGHLQVVRTGYLDAGPADPASFLLPAPGPELDSVRATAGVRVVSEKLSFYGFASRDDATASFLGEGVDPVYEPLLSEALEIVAGERLPIDDPDTVLLGLGLAATLGARVGDRVVLVVNKPNGGINAVELRVTGLFATVSKDYDDTALRLPVSTARRLLNVRGAHRWLVLLDDTASTGSVGAAMAAALPADRFRVVRWDELADFYRKTVDLFSRQVRVVEVIIAVLIALGIGNTLSMVVLERTTEIGTSMALGMRRRSVLAQFLVEGTTLGALGGVTGVALGLALAALVSRIGIPMPPPPGMSQGYTAEIRITASLVRDALLLALAATFAASALPAWRASRLTIVDALRTSR